MLTPQEILEHTFAKSVVGGYNVAMVDEFLRTVSGEYAELSRENAEMKSKLKTLADKIKEYRETEDSMRATLLSAQKMASNMVEDAQDRAADIVAEAEKQAEDKLRSLREEIAKEEKRLKHARKESDAFFAQMHNICEKYIQSLDSAPIFRQEKGEEASEGNSESHSTEEGEEDSAISSSEEEEENATEEDVMPSEEEAEEQADTSTQEEETSRGDTMVYSPTKLDDLRFGRDQRNGRKKRGKGS